MKYLLTTFAALLPLTHLFAYEVDTPTDFRSLLGNFNDILRLLIPLIIGLTFLTISWGVIKAWIMSDATEDDIEKGKKVALVGVIVLVVMSGIWGILALLQEGIFG